MDQEGAPMASGPMVFGNNGMGNDAGPAQTTLLSTNDTTALLVVNNGGISAVTGRGRIGVRGEGGADRAAVYGVNDATGNGVAGNSMNLNGVQGVSFSKGASGVYGENLSSGGFGVAGRSNVPPPTFPFLPSPFGAAVLGDNTAGGAAGAFNGNVSVTGYLHKLGGGFLIDSPIDPANRYLCHSFVESPDMMNVYNGNVTTDDDGNATVELPGYFEALNRDFRYQLTVLGQFAQAIVAQEVRGNRFGIKTDKPNVRVSWQVTGIRQDAWANAHRTEADLEKPDGHRGKYLTPADHDQSAAAGIYYMEPLVSEETQVDSSKRQEENKY
jgi:hypothetical protein